MASTSTCWAGYPDRVRDVQTSGLMLETQLQHLSCPDCRGPLALTGNEGNGRVREGMLESECGNRFPITEYIPRFVPDENYAASFGLEWTKHARTQYDSHSGVPLSATRFFGETGWLRQMEGEIIIEAGCGSGRFTEQAASTGATVLSFDYSRAVDANYQLNGSNPNVLIVQADIYRMPFPDDYADRLFCFGVLQHTPDPQLAFNALPRHVKPGGELVADVYVKSLKRTVLTPKYLVRRSTRRIDPHRLYRYVRRYVDLMWPFASLIRRIPKLGPVINWRLLIADYSNEGVPTAVLKDWAYLDTFDMLAPRYDSPQTLKTVQRWITELPDIEGEAFYGYNGVTIRAKRSQGAP